MNANPAVIRVPGLTRLDQLELQSNANLGAVRFEEEQIEGGSHGELATVTAIIIVTALTLQTLAIFLARKSEGKTFKKTVEVIRPDGTRESATIEYTAKSTEPPDAAILKQLGAIYQIDPDILTQTTPKE